MTFFDRIRSLFRGNKKTAQAHATHGTSGAARHAVRKPKAHQPGRDTSAAFQANRFEAFMAGESVDIYTSDMVRSAEWSEDAGLLKITFVNGGQPYYYPCDEQEAIAFANAPSKGGALHDMWISKGVKGSP